MEGAANDQVTFAQGDVAQERLEQRLHLLGVDNALAMVTDKLVPTPPCGACDRRAQCR